MGRMSVCCVDLTSDGRILLTVGLKSKVNITPIRFVLRVPNPLEISNISEAPFFDDFIKYDGCNDTENTLAELRYLRAEIDEYVQSNSLYCDINYTMPRQYIIM